MASLNYAGLNWKAIYGNFKILGLSQRVFTLHKLPKLLPNDSPIPSIKTVNNYFHAFKNEFAQLEQGSKQGSQFDFRVFYFDMKAKGMSLEGYYFTYIKDKYPISRTCFLKNLESIKDSLYKAGKDMEENTKEIEQFVNITTIDKTALTGKSDFTTRSRNLAKEAKVLEPSKVTLNINGVDISFESTSVELSVALVASYLKYLS